MVRVIIPRVFEVIHEPRDTTGYLFYAEDERDVRAQISGPLPITLVTLTARVIIPSKDDPEVELSVLIPIKVCSYGSTLLDHAGNIVAVPCPPYCTDDPQIDEILLAAVEPELPKITAKLPEPFRRRSRRP